MPPPTAALLLLALPHGPAYGAQGAPTICGNEIQERILAETRQFLCSLPFAAEECFVVNTIPLSFRRLKGALWGTFDWGRIILNAERLEKGCAMLARKGRNIEQLPRLLAPVWAPTLAHEARHAVNQANVRGAWKLTEDEASAFFVQGLVMEEALRRFPDSFDEELMIVVEDLDFQKEWRLLGPAAFRSSYGADYIADGYIEISAADGPAVSAGRAAEFGNKNEQFAAYAHKHGVEKLRGRTMPEIRTQEELDLVLDRLETTTRLLAEPHEAAWAREYFRRDACLRWSQWLARFPDKEPKSREQVASCAEVITTELSPG